MTSVTQATAAEDDLFTSDWDKEVKLAIKHESFADSKNLMLKTACQIQYLVHDLKASAGNARFQHCDFSLSICLRSTRTGTASIRVSLPEQASIYDQLCR